MIADGIFTLLSTAAPISALVGTRIYPVNLPEKPILPAIVYYTAGGTSEPTFETSGLQKLRYQFDCYGELFGDADRTRDALVAFLNGYQGTLSNGIVLQDAIYLQPIDGFKDAPRQFCLGVEFYFLFTLPRT